MSRSISGLRPHRIALVALVLLLVSAVPLPAQTVARCGRGWLELIDGYKVLHLKGQPWEMGYQHGALLKESATKNMTTIITEKGNETLVELGSLKVTPRVAIDTIQKIQEKYVPRKFYEELEGLAAGSGLRLGDIRAGNFLPEMFHCSGFAVMNSATKDGTLYHGRVLDYAIDWGLQEHAVVVVAEPDGGIPYVNITYAGFIGSVTGMNARGVSVGEMGGGGQGHWKGVPMAFLVREALEKSTDLDEAIAIFRDSPRTCQYFYVIADGQTNRAVGMEASWNTFMTVKPGEAHSLLPTPVKDAVLLSAGDRYKELCRRAGAAYGQLDAESALRLMDRGVAMKSNLHNVLFEPKTTRFWVANASADKKPAAEQKYFAFQLSELLTRHPEASAPDLPMPARTALAPSETLKK
jgi:isopenicillin-N N-acyltransferase-like protein